MCRGGGDPSHNFTFSPWRSLPLRPILKLNSADRSRRCFKEENTCLRPLLLIWLPQPPLQIDGGPASLFIFPAD